MSTNDINDLVKLRTLLVRAWNNKQMVSIVPGQELGVIRVILYDEDRTIVEHSGMSLPDDSSLIAAIVEGLSRALEEADRE